MKSYLWYEDDKMRAQHNTHYLGRNHVQRDNIYLAGEGWGGYMAAPVISKSGRVTQSWIQINVICH